MVLVNMDIPECYSVSLCSLCLLRVGQAFQMNRENHVYLETVRTVRRTVGGSRSLHQYMLF